jgi:3-hydroxyisobutyrate dehydrogenase-like beta-hydroxyacid dehydrogenase
MLVHDAAVREVAFGPKGLCESLPKGAIHILMGTHGVAAVRELEARHREAGQTLVAAPVLGRPDLAASGQLGIVAGGPEAAVARVKALLDVMGRKTFSAGPKPESATAIKLANNAVLGCAMVAMAEGFSLIRKYSVAPQVFQDVMTEGLFSAPAYKIYGQKMVDESFDQVGSPISVGLKDAKLIAEAGTIANVPMPSHNIYLDRLIGATAHGDGERDQAVLGREQGRAAGIE